MIKTLLLDEWRFLTFRPVSPEVRTHWFAFLALGLFFTGGIPPNERSANDGAYVVVVTLSLIAVFLAPLLVISYL